MIHNHTHGNVDGGFLQHASILVIITVNIPNVFKLRQVLMDGIIERNLTFLNQFCNRNSAKSLRLRTLHKWVVERDPALLRHIGVSHACDFLEAVFV